MAKKNETPICPHTGGLGLCEMAQHLQMWDFICLSQSTQNRLIEFIDYKHGYFVNPVHIINGRYMPPTLPGYSTMFKQKVIERWSYPSGSRWRHLFHLGFPTYFQRKKQQEEKGERKCRRGFPTRKSENKQTEREKKEETQETEEKIK
ncbi:mitochondrial enolase superfamily member 1 [Ooceraea biroi]|nr:mitochondrial enolase superfamily member 1 [Ooceraea biroi]